MLFTTSRKKKLYQLLSTFLVDTSVLVFVFVPLDVLLQFGRSTLSFTVLFASTMVAALVFVLAFIISFMGEEL